MIRVFIGYDPRESAAWFTLAHSIMERSSRPVSITPIALKNLDGVFTRERDPLQSTDFSFTRFLTPYMSGYEGWSIFLDCNMLVLDDIASLWDMRDNRYAVQVVKDQHEPAETTKFLTQPQTSYQKKNWSSVMLMNNAACHRLTPEYVNQASGLELHQFKWLDSDEQIGELPDSWNHLVGYNQPREEVSLIHYTVGGPYFDQWRDCEYAEHWFDQRERMLRVDQV